MFDPIVKGLETAIDARNRSHSVIVSNLANADTPGFRAQRLEFESALAGVLSTGATPAGALTRTNDHHLDAGGGTEASVGQVVEASDPSAPGLDGNTVDRDAEAARLAENQILYRASTKAIARQFALLRYAITESGR